MRHFFSEKYDDNSINEGNVYHTFSRNNEPEASDY